MDKLLESTSMTYQLAYHFSQLKYFEGKNIEEYNDDILKNHITKTGNLFQKNFQKALNLYSAYAEKCNDGKIIFYDNEEKLEFFELLIDTHKYFYANDKQYEKKEFYTSLGVKEMEEWIPRLEQLTNKISIIYYFLAGKVIENHSINKE